MCSASHFLNLFLIFSFLSPLLTSQEPVDVDVGIGIGIGIGIGGGTPPESPPCGDCPPPAPEPKCPPPVPPPGPQPSDFVNLKQYVAYNVIQRFKKTITCGPKKVTDTWVGYRPCKYTGFFCETPPGLKDTPTIASVDFNGFGLCAPTISGFIDKLPDLALFHANSNKFTGTVPDLTKLKFLYELDLSNNRLSGQFPSTLLPLRQLIFLDIRFNTFSGSVPGNIFKLDLAVLFLNNNGFSQPLPANLGATPVLYLTLANNAFTGPIPASICNTSNTLVEVLFLNNKLSGCLPFEVGLLKKATVFDAGFNRITGPIPLSFACLEKIEQLNLAGNLLYGRVPDLVCKLAKFGNLANLSLSDNYFTSVGDSCWDLIRRKVLDVRKNCIVGLPNQRPAWECAAFSAKPKYCPYVSFIPCAFHHRRLAGDGREGVPVAAPAVTSLAEPGSGSGSGSVTYGALHERHGK